MTRINSAIPVSALTDEHLLAEHREITRLPSLYAKGKDSKSLSVPPNTFVLGTGHVLFFLDKPIFCYNRYVDIYRELLKRRINVKFNGVVWYEKYSAKDMIFSKKYKTTEQEKKLLVNRITQRILESKKKNFRYYGKTISKEEAINILISNSEVNYNNYE